LTQDDLDRTARYLNTEFSGKSLLAIRAEIVELMKEEKALYDRLLQNAICCVSAVSKARKRAGRLRRRHFQHSYKAGIRRHRAHARAVPDV
jgi:transcriptional regulator of heat shock response